MPLMPLHPPLRRYENWDARLSTFLRENSTREFSWGTWDCCLFAADAIVAMTGIDIAVDLRNTYTSRRESFQAIRSYLNLPPESEVTVADVVEEVADRFSIPEIEVGFAQRGDMVLVPRLLGPALGIVALNGRYVISTGEDSAGNDTIGPVAPLSSAIRAWRIG